MTRATGLRPRGILREDCEEWTTVSVIINLIIININTFICMTHISIGPVRVLYTDITHAKWDLSYDLLYETNGYIFHDQFQYNGIFSKYNRCNLNVTIVIVLLSET